MVCYFTSHHNEKCETILNETILNERWCVTLHHIIMRSVRLHSMNAMKGGVFYFTSHHNEKCETILNAWWCVTLHHITMRSVRLPSMKGGVILYITSQ